MGVGFRVRVIAVKVFEELKGFGSMVPEAFEDFVNELWGPRDGGVG